MSAILPVRNSQIFPPQSELQREGSGAIPGAQGAGQRTFVQVHNLHEGDKFAAAWKRVDASQDAITERLGKKVVKYYDFSPKNAEGITEPKLRLRELNTSSDLKKNAENVRLEFAALREALADTSPEYKAKLEELDKQERARLDLQAGLLKGWWNKFRDVFTEQHREVGLDISFRANVGEVTTGPGTLVIGITKNEAGQKMLAEQNANRQPQISPPPVDVNRQPALLEPPGAQAQPDPAAAAQEGLQPIFVNRQNISDHNDTARRGGWRALGGLGFFGGAGIATAGGLVTWAGLGAAVGLSAAAAPVVGIGLLAAGGLTAGYLVIKWAFLKRPWWGQTELGKMQKAERQQALALHDEIRKAVKEQVLRSPTQSNLDVKFGELHKRYLTGDPAMMSDFIKLAKQKNHTQLRKLVREQLLNTEKSFLGEETIKNARKLEGGRLSRIMARLKAIGTGNEAGHAQKTLNRAVDAIVSGIETGICEGAIQIITGELSDNASVASQKKILDIAQARKDEFARAVAFLKPSRVAGADGENDVPNVHQLHEIYEVDQREEALIRLRDEVVIDGQQRLGKTADMINKFRAAKDVIGAQNVEAFSKQLGDMDADIAAHIKSLEDVRKLLRMPANAAGEALEEPPVSVERINRDLIGALEASVQDGADVTTQAFEALAKDLQSLNEAIASQEKTPNLIKSQADKLTELLSAVEKSVNTCKALSTTLSQSRDDLAKPTDLAGVKRVKERLDQQLGQLGRLPTGFAPANGPDDPVGRKIVAAVRGVEVEMQRISALCEEISLASSDSTRLVDLQREARKVAKESGFKQALDSAKFKDFENNVQLQKKRLGEWAKNPNFKVPTDLKVFTDRDIEQLKLDMVADAIGLGEETRKTLQPALSRLADSAHEPLIQSLKELPGEAAGKLLRVIASAITASENQPPREAAVACLSAAMRSGVQLDKEDAQRLSLVQALFPAQVDLLQKYSNALAAENALTKAFGADLGQAIQDWKVEKGGGGEPPPQTRASQLQTLLEFVKEKELDKGLADAISTGQRLLGNSDELLFQRDAAGIVAALETLSSDDLRLLESLAQNLCEPLKKEAKELKDIKRRRELEAQAAFEASKKQLMDGAQPGEKVEAVVHQVAQAINNQAAELNQKGAAVKQQVNDIIENRQEISILETERNNLAEELKALIGSTDNAQVLAMRIDAHPETRQHLLTLIHANSLLGNPGPMVPEAFRASIRKEDTIRGAEDIAKTRALSQLEQENLKQRIDAEKATRLFKRLEDRQTTGEKFKNRKTGETKAPKELAKILVRDDRADEFVKRYLNEEVAYNTLWTVAGQESKSSLHIRSLLEGNLTQQEVAFRGNLISQAGILSSANFTKLRNNLLSTLGKREEALQGLTAIIQRNGESEVYLGTFNRELARLAEIRGSIPANIGAAFDDPGSGELAKLGEILREAQPFVDREVIDIQKAYLSEQVKESRKALAWFNLKHLSVANGLFSRLAFVVARKGERLNRVLNTTQALEIGRRIAKIAASGAEADGLAKKAEVLNEQLRTLQTNRDALVKDPRKLAVALRMLAFEHLQAKGGGDATLSEADVEAVLHKFKDMTGSENFVDMENAALGRLSQVGVPCLVGASVKTLVQQISETDQQTVALQLEALNKEEAKIAETLSKLREAANQERLKQGSDDEKTIRRLMIRAGLDLIQGDTEHYDTLARGKSGLGGVFQKSSVNAELVETQLTHWASLRRDLEAGEPATAVVARANALKRDWETKIHLKLSAEGSKERLQSAQALLASLEFSLLEAIGPSGPVQLQSGNSEAVQRANALKTVVASVSKNQKLTLSELEKLQPKVGDSSDLSAAAIGRYTIESTLDLGKNPKKNPPTTKNLAIAEVRIMQLWEAALPAHLDASQPSNPPDWALMRTLIDARAAMSTIYSNLAQSQEALAFSRLPKGNGNLDSAIDLDAPEIERLRNRALWHETAADVGEDILATSIRQWAGEAGHAEVADSFGEGESGRAVTGTQLRKSIDALNSLERKALTEGSEVDDTYVDTKPQHLMGAMIGP